MKLATFSHQGRRSAGIVRDNVVVDLFAGEPSPPPMEVLLAQGTAALAKLAASASSRNAVPLNSVRLHAPVERPSKFLAIAANYQSHIDEVLAANPSYVSPASQRWFAKVPGCINAPFDPILMPPESAQVDYEAELAVIIGRRCRRVSASEAAGVIAGYTVCNDVSVRDWQSRSGLVLGKSFDTHGPLGPWLVTADEIEDPHRLAIRCTVNGEVRQNGSTAEMIHNCFEQIAYVSCACTLEPGDVIATGTPKGTGGSMKPPRFLVPGDIVRCEIERIGAIEAVVKVEDIQ